MDHLYLFADARILINRLEDAYCAAIQAGITSGVLARSKGGITAELQWPWHGYDPRIERRSDFNMRFFIEARQDQAQVEPPAAEPVEDEPADVEELPLDPGV